jgi:hypothetical protein
MIFTGLAIFTLTALQAFEAKKVEPPMLESAKQAGPKAIGPDQREAIAVVWLEMQMAQIQILAMRTLEEVKVADMLTAERQYEKKRQEWLAAIAKASTQSGADGCNLNFKREWLCPPKPDQTKDEKK